MVQEYLHTPCFQVAPNYLRTIGGLVLSWEEKNEAGADFHGWKNPFLDYGA